MIKATIKKELEHIWEAIVELRAQVDRLDNRTTGSIRVGGNRIPKIDGGFLDD